MIYVQQEINEFTYDNIGSLILEYDTSTTYNIGDLARVGSYVYKSALDSNTGKDPLENLNIYWIEWQPANDYALLDMYEETKTEWVADGVAEFVRSRKDSLGIGNFKATKVLVQYLDDSKVEIARDEYAFSSNGEVWDEWSYGYAVFTDSVDKVVFVNLKKVGTYVRVTFSADGENTNCGYFISGTGVDMGETLDDVSFPDKRLGKKTVNTASFRTKVINTYLMRKTLQAKKLKDEPMMFVIDPSLNSLHDNMVILGKITQCDATASQMSKNQISWTIDQQIQE